MKINNRKLKEATKAGIAFVIVYAIAINLGWMKPSWAGFTVAMIAGPNIFLGQSIKKSTHRIIGTIIGMIGSLLIIIIAPQQRWLFTFLISLWVGLNTILALSNIKNRDIWMAIGFTVPVILMCWPTTSQNALETALFRSIETIMSVIVYLIISSLVWPYSAKGLTRKSIDKTIVDVNKAIYAFFQSEKLSEIIKLDKVISSYIQTLEKEENEGYFSSQEIKYWRHILFLLNHLKINLQKIEVLKSSISKKDFLVVQAALQNTLRWQNDKLIIASDFQTKLSKSISKGEEVCFLVETVQEVFSLLLELERMKNEGELTSENYIITAKTKEWRWSIDILNRGLFSSVLVFTSLAFYFFVNPPGHQMWFLVGANSFVVSIMPKINIKQLLVRYVSFGVLILLVYGLILPLSDSYYFLSIVLFILMFLQYYFTDGVSYIFISICILNLGIQNGQVYNMENMINNLLFDGMLFSWILGVSYILYNARPEKNILLLLKKYLNALLYVYNHLETKKGILGKLKLKVASEIISDTPTLFYQFYTYIPENNFFKEVKEHLEEVSYQLFDISRIIEHLLQNEDSEWHMDDTLSHQIKNIIELIRGNNGMIDSVQQFSNVENRLIYKRLLNIEKEYNEINLAVLKEERF